MNLIVAILIFIFGTVIGSFLSVVIFRLRHNLKGIFFSRSICPNCKKKLKWRYLIPVISWLFLRGKCGYCGKKISAHYFLLELTNGLLFLTAFLFFNFLNQVPSTVDPSIINFTVNYQALYLFIFYLILFTLFVAIFFYDLLYKEIPDRFSIPAIVIAFAGNIFFNLQSIENMLIGAAAIFLFFAVQYFGSKGRWLGGGDLRMGILMGILFGWELGLMALVISYLFGAIISLVLLLSKKATRKSTVPLGPFLITGSIITLLYGNEILQWYLGNLTF